MRISSFNINKFCGAYSSKNGGYYNPRNIDFKSPIKNIVDSLLRGREDIVFLQEFTDNSYIEISELFHKEEYMIWGNSDFRKDRSNVVAITLKERPWEKTDLPENTEFCNKIIGMERTDKKLRILCFHNTDEKIKNEINEQFKKGQFDIILGDFNDSKWIQMLNEEIPEYRDLVTDDMITYKPAQTSIDRIFVKKEKFLNKIVFNGVIETYASDHNILSFLLNA